MSSTDRESHIVANSPTNRGEFSSCKFRFINLPGLFKIFGDALADVGEQRAGDEADFVLVHAIRVPSS